jgi:phage head maturation protease
MSFGFIPRDIEFDADGVRHIKRGTLLHVSPVYSPAFPQTTVALSRAINDMKRKLLELKAKL